MNISDLIYDEKILGKSPVRRAKKRSVGSNNNLNDSRNSRDINFDKRSHGQRSVDSKHSSPNLRHYGQGMELIEANSSDEDSDKLKGTGGPKNTSKERRPIAKGKGKGKKVRKNNNAKMNYNTGSEERLAVK